MPDTKYKKDETCATCGLFRRDTVNPVEGIGDCPENVTRVNLDGFIVPILKYPGQRGCQKWEGRKIVSRFNSERIPVGLQQCLVRKI